MPLAKANSFHTANFSIDSSQKNPVCGSWYQLILLRSTNDNFTCCILYVVNMANRILQFRCTWRFRIVTGCFYRTGWLLRQCNLGNQRDSRNDAWKRKRDCLWNGWKSHCGYEERGRLEYFTLRRFVRSSLFSFPWPAKRQQRAIISRIGFEYLRICWWSGRLWNKSSKINWSEEFFLSRTTFTPHFPVVLW